MACRKLDLNVAFNANLTGDFGRICKFPKVSKASS
jgi:hypothetical protein